jgi:peptide/nickel transport system substrate-binding protein
MVKGRAPLYYTTYRCRIHENNYNPKHIQTTKEEKKIMYRKLFVLAAILVIAASVLSGCKPSRPMVIIASDQPGPADPAENWTFGGAAYLPQVYETLFSFSGPKTPSLVRSLAYNFAEVTTDGLSYTIYLKTEATFHDGTPVTAEAVVYSYERMKALNKGANAIAAEYIESITALDPYAVRIVLKSAYADFGAAMGSVWGNYIINPKLCKEHEVNGDWCYNWLLTNDAGSGPYKLANVDTATNTITLERHAKWWKKWENNKAPDKVIIRWLSDPSQARLMLEKGEADIAVGLPTNDYLALSKTAGFVPYKNPSIMQYYLAFNGSAAPLDNKLVRQALQYSFNTDKVISDIFGGNLAKMEMAIGPSYTTLYKVKTKYPYDLEKAKSLLTEAGYPDGFEITANVMGFWANDKAVLEFWQADLAKIGVTLNIQQIDGGTWGDAWWNCKATETPNIGQISAMAVGADYPSPWELLAQVYPTPRMGGECSTVYLNNPLVNESMQKLLLETNSANRKTIFEPMLESIADDAGAIWVGQAMDLVIMRDVVRGYEYSFARGANYFPLEKMSLTK